MLDGYLGYSAADWERMAQTTLAQHIRELEDASLRNYQMGAQLQAYSRTLYNQAGRGIDWPVKYRNHPVEGNTGQTERNFSRVNLYKQAFTEYRGYQTTDSMTEEEFLANGPGETQIIAVFDQFVERLTTSLNEFMGLQYYIDGSLAANAQFWEGLETIFQFNGTIKFDDGTQRATNDADYAAFPSGSYAGLTMNLGTYGGNNQSGQIWPNGLSDPQFDFWAPLGVHSDNTAFSTDTTPLYAAVRWGLTHIDRNRSLTGQVTNVVGDRESYRQLKEQADTKERIIVTSETGLKALGFMDVINFDGRELSWEVAVPPDTLYGYNYANIEMRSRYDMLTKSEGPFYDYFTQNYNAVVKSRSNLRYKSPRNFVKWAKTFG